MTFLNSTAGEVLVVIWDLFWGTIFIFFGTKIIIASRKRNKK